MMTHPADTMHPVDRFRTIPVEGDTMTDTNEAVIHEALTVIDKALAQMMSRELVSTGEVTDVLLDVRSLLTLPDRTPVASA
jgi:hypothetical protein